MWQVTILQLCYQHLSISLILHLTKDVQKVDRTIHWINHYPVGKDNGFRDTGLLDGDISGG